MFFLFSFKYDDATIKLGDSMKKIVYIIILLFIFTFSVSAKEIAPSKINDVINNGEVTKAFIKRHKNCDISIKASGSTNVSVSYNVSCKVKEDKEEVTKNYNGNFELVYDGANNRLETEVKVGKKEIGNDPYLINVMKLVPYWDAEASEKFTQIKKKIGKKDVLEEMERIFDRCYLGEMGVCYMETPSYGDMIYSAKIVLDDTAADYALKVLKEDAEAQENKELNKMLIIVAVGLLALIVIFKSLTPGKEKY